MRCPRSFLVVNFSHFQLLLWNHRMEFDETWQKARTQRPLPILCFPGGSENQDGHLCLWFAKTLSIFPLNPWTEFDETWQEAKTWCPLPSLCFWGRSENQDDHLNLWLAEKFSTSPLKPLNRIQRNLTGSQISTSYTNFVVFFLGGGGGGQPRWLPWPICQRKWHIVLRCTLCGPLGHLFLFHHQPVSSVSTQLCLPSLLASVHRHHIHLVSSSSQVPRLQNARQVHF